MSDEDKKLLSLIDACVKGEEKAWNLFVGQDGKVVKGCLSAYFRGRAERIDEVTQQVFIKVWKVGLRDFRGANRYQFLSYLKQIAINEAKTYLRSTVRQKREVSLNQDPTSGDDVGYMSEMASEAPNPEEITMVAERIEILANHFTESVFFSDDAKVLEASRKVTHIPGFCLAAKRRRLFSRYGGSGSAFFSRKSSSLNSTSWLRQ